MKQCSRHPAHVAPARADERAGPAERWLRAMGRHRTRSLTHWRLEEEPSTATCVCPEPGAGRSTRRVGLMPAFADAACSMVACAALEAGVRAGTYERAHRSSNTSCHCRRSLVRLQLQPPDGPEVV